MSKRRILVVEDDNLLAGEIRNTLNGLGYEVSGTASSGEEAISRAAEMHPDLVLMDIVLKGNVDGVRAAEHISSHFGIPVVYLSARADDATLRRARITEPYGYILKPFEKRELHTNIEIALYRHRTEKELRERERALQSDIATRKKTEEALRESEERYRILIENAHDMIQSVAPDGRFVFVNSAWCSTLGYTREEVRTLTLFDVLHPDCKTHCSEIFRRVMSGEPVDNVAVTFVGKDGRCIDAEGNVSVRSVGGKVIATQGIFRDVTERKKAEMERARLETQLLHVQKMEAIGVLSGGIAHEFNNILTVILGYGELLLQGIGQDSPLRPYMEMIHTSAMRATHLTQSLLAYSRKQIMNSKPMDLNETVRNVGGLLSRLIGENIELRTIPAAEEVVVLADSGQIEQVLMNLATNARDAMPEGGLLTIEIARAPLDDGFVKVHGYGKPGLYGVIRVRDTGIGMNDAVRERIFEPFFTTKESGKGTGLGLAMVYGIIKQHNGYIEVQSAPGKGTAFTIYLPLVRTDVEKKEPAGIPSFGGGTETVLVAEDDPVVRRLTRDVLQRGGYQVVEAVDGEDAIEKFLEHKNSIRLLIFDVMMPKRNGRETYEHIRKIDPDIKVIFMSGYPSDLVGTDGLRPEVHHFLAKPVSVSGLSKMVREVLDS